MFNFVRDNKILFSEYDVIYYRRGLIVEFIPLFGETVAFEICESGVKPLCKGQVLFIFPKQFSGFRVYNVLGL